LWIDLLVFPNYQVIMLVLTQKSTYIVLFAGLLLAAACAQPGTNQQGPEGAAGISVASYGVPVLDGSASDEVWDLCEWKALDQLWEGSNLDKADFQGQYKLLWDENNLYILAEIQDDTLVDMHPDGLERYWDDDCLVVMVDEDGSGGSHAFNYNAFAYHIGLDARVVDVAVDSSFQYYDDHCVCRRTTTGNSSVWEVAVRLHDGNQYRDNQENIPKSIQAGKKIRFALAYCDNDRSEAREHLFGSLPLPDGGTTTPLTEASLMGLLELK
jgi:hypothetical protein